MKRWIIGLLLLLLCMDACAEGAETSAIFEFAESYGASELTEDIYKSVLDGDISDFETIFEWLHTKLLTPFIHVGKVAASALIPVILLAILRGCLPEASGAGDGVCFLLRLTLLLGFSDIAGLSLTASEACIKRAAEFTQVIAPGVTALLASVGMNTAAALASPAAVLTGNIAENVFLRYGLPLCKGALCMVIAGNLSNAVELNRFTNLLKKLANWGTGLISTLFTALITVQGSIAETADSLGVRTAKFAVDNASPVIGNGMTDAWESFVSGVMITKNALGMSGIAALLAAGIQPLVSCAASMLVLYLLASALELFGENETARAAEQIGGICQMSLALSTGSLVIVTVLMGTAMSVGRNIFA